MFYKQISAITYNNKYIHLEYIYIYSLNIFIQLNPYILFIVFTINTCETIFEQKIEILSDGY